MAITTEPTIHYTEQQLSGVVIIRNHNAHNITIARQGLSAVQINEFNITLHLSGSRLPLQVTDSDAAHYWANQLAMFMSGGPGFYIDNRVDA